MSAADTIELPVWARASASRRGHIARVVELLDRWAAALRLDATEHAAWRDAGRWHDALRDAPEPELRAILPASDAPAGLLHGPASAALLERDGETRRDVLEAIRWHTVGRADWARTGRALYMADFLDPGRPFSRADRAYLAARVPDDFEGTFRQVVRLRIERALREGDALSPETVGMWNAAR